jgi:hypothetical protein
MCIHTHYVYIYEHVIIHMYNIIYGVQPQAVTFRGFVYA